VRALAIGVGASVSLLAWTVFLGGIVLALLSSQDSSND
jgi:hypothetical protein